MTEPPSDLRAAASSAVKWNAVGQGGRQLVSFFVSIALARLVTPREFGLLAMLFIFQEIANAFVNSGLNAPLIQRDEVSDEDCSTVFYFNIAVSGLCYLALLLSAPPIARFYGEPELETIIAIYGLAFVIHSFGNVQLGLLIRHLDYRQINLVMLAGVLVSGVLAVLMALRGYGVYSLLGQHVSYALTTNALYWHLSPWRPTRSFSTQSLKRFFGAGSRVLVVSMTDKVLGTIDDLFIGKLQGTVFLGHYSRGKTTRDLPLTQVNGVITSLVFPLFSRIKDRGELRKALVRFLGVVTYVTAPIMVGMFLLAEPLIVTLYSDTWRPAVPFLRLFCVFGIAVPLNAVLVQTLMAHGDYDRFFWLEMGKKGLLLASMSLGAAFGPKEMIWGLCFAQYLALAVSLRIVGRILDLPTATLVRSGLPALSLAALTAVPVYLVWSLPWSSVAASLAAPVAVGVLAYWGLSVLARSKEYGFLRDALLTHLRRA